MTKAVNAHASLQFKATMHGSDRPVQYRYLRPTRANCRYWRIQVNTQIPNYLSNSAMPWHLPVPGKKHKILCPYRPVPSAILNNSPVAATLKSNHWATLAALRPAIQAFLTPVVLVFTATGDGDDITAMRPKSPIPILAGTLPKQPSFPVCNPFASSGYYPRVVLLRARQRELNIIRSVSIADAGTCS